MESEKLANFLEERIEELKKTLRELEKLRDSQYNVIRREKEEEKIKVKEGLEKNRKELIKKYHLNRLPKIFKMYGEGITYNINDELHQSLVSFITILKRAATVSEDSKSNLDSKLKELKEEAQEGDLIDIDGYRGVGLYYVYSWKGKLYVRKTPSEYGYFLPREALPFLKKLNIETQYDLENVYGGVDIYGIESPDLEHEGEYLGFKGGPMSDDGDEFTFHLKDW